MQAEITFSENTVSENTAGTKVADHLKTFPAIRLMQGLRQSIEESDWDGRLLRHEKYFNRVCFAIIIAAVIYLTPVCVTIFIR
jgi:hypothetical protein